MNPNWKQIVREHLAVLRLPPEREIEIVEELAAHLEATYEDALAAGLSEAEAEARALRSYDWRLLECELSRTEQPPAVRAMRPSLELIERKGGLRMESLIQDLRFGMRMLMKNPGFTLIAVVTLALGIGANTSIFSLVNAVLLRPLPFPEAGRLAQVWNTNLEKGITSFAITVRDYTDWRKRSQAFERLAAYRFWTFTLTGGGEPEQLPGNNVSASFFSTLGVSPLLGRTFLPAEEQPGGAPVVALSHGLWQRRFGGDPGIINQTVMLDGKAYTVVGVMPAGFAFPIRTKPAELWTPLVFQPAELERGGNNLQVLGRLKPSLALKQAQAELSDLSRQLEAGRPTSGLRFDVRVISLAQAVAGDVQSVLLLLLGAVGCVLLIACANVANLLLARAATRYREIAVRRALGASRGRLTAQLLTESALLSLLGGTLGLALAWFSLDLLVTLSPINLPRAEQARIDGWVLAFTFCLSLFTSLLFGLAPALQSARVNLNDALKEGARHGANSRSGSRLRRLLVVTEIAMALVLLICASLLLQSFARLYRVDSGINTQNVLTAALSLNSSQYQDTPGRIIFTRELLERVRALPEAQAAGLTSDLPLRGSAITESFTIEGRPAPEARHQAGWYTASASYFRALGVPLLRGRDFTEQDAETSPRVVIINQTLARRFWPAGEAVGQHIKIANDLPREIIGVVGDTKHLGLDKETMPEMYVPYAQARYLMSVQLVVRTIADPLRVADALRRQVLALNPNQPVSQIKTMEQCLSEGVALPRFRSVLLGLFSALALALAVIGLYGVMSYTVTQRTHELGVRLALGAQAADVLKLILKQGLKLALSGIVIGLLTALALTRWIETLLFNVRPTDPLTFTVIALLLLAVALLACWLPARRATKVDPLIALRHE